MGFPEPEAQVPFKEFISIVSAVMFGNALTLAYVYALWRFVQAEKQGLSTNKMPFMLYVYGIAGPLIAAFGIYITVI